MLIKHVKYLVIITSKDLLIDVLVSLPLETILMFMLKNAVKKKLFEKIRKKNHAQVAHSFNKTAKHITKFLKILKNADYRKKISKHVERNIYKCIEVFSFA